MMLSGCLGERLISFSKSYYNQNNNMLCVDHSKDVKTGRIHEMGEDMVIKLQRKGPRTSCVPFKIKDNQISVKTINNRTVNIAPYKSYYFSSNTYRNNGEANKQSGAGPNICFTKQNGEFILHVVNGGDLTNKIAGFGCS